MSLGFVLAVTFSIFLGILTYYLWIWTYWMRKGVKGPRGRPFVGVLDVLLEHETPGLIKLGEWTKKYGKVYGYTDGTQRTLVVADPAMVHEIFVKQFDNFYGRKLNPIQGNPEKEQRVHLLAAQGYRWKSDKARLRVEMDVSMLQSPQKRIKTIQKLAVSKKDVHDFKDIFEMLEEQKEKRNINIIQYDSLDDLSGDWSEYTFFCGNFDSDLFRTLTKHQETQALFIIGASVLKNKLLKNEDLMTLRAARPLYCELMKDVTMKLAAEVPNKRELVDLVHYMGGSVRKDTVSRTNVFIAAKVEGNKKMTESVLENPIFIRSCILNEVLHRKPIRESYKNFCEKLGDDVMDYIDFEFWFYRFYEGNHDLNYDQKLEPKNLSDMPIKILQRILNELCFRDKMVLQKVCRILRKVVPEIDAAAHSAVSFRMCRDWTFLEFSKHEIVYREFEGGCIVKYEDYAKPVIGGNQLELALNDFSNFLKCPKLHLKHFGVTFSSAVGEEARQEVIETVGTLKWPNLKTVFFNGIHQSEIKPMITCFNSETIEHIILDVSRDSSNFELNADVYESAKWKHAKIIQICGDCELSIPFAKIFTAIIFLIK